MRKTDIEENNNGSRPSGCQMWGCKANGCRLVACVNGLCTFHDEVSDFSNRWPFVTELINGPDFRMMLKAVRHVMRYGDCGAERKDQAASLMRNAYRAGIALGFSKDVLNPKVDKDGDKERLEPMARRYFYAMHKYVRDTAMAQNIKSSPETNLEDLAAKKSFENAMDPNVF